jgi:hypothetical protein
MPGASFPTHRVEAILRAVSMNYDCERNHLVARRLLPLAVLFVCLAAVSTTANAAQPGDETGARLYSPGQYPDSSPQYPGVSRYYGSVDPNPMGYYSYAYFDGPAFPVRRAIGYYPYPDPHPYVNVPPFPFGYWGYGGYGAWPYGFPGWGWGAGWGWGGFWF